MFTDFLSYILFNHISKQHLNFLIIKVSNSCNTRPKYNNGINANTAKTYNSIQNKNAILFLGITP